MLSDTYVLLAKISIIAPYHILKLPPYNFIIYYGYYVHYRVIIHDTEW